MTIEVEIKAKISDKIEPLSKYNPVLSKLVSNLESKKFVSENVPQELSDTYYDTPDGKLAASGKNLRVRYAGVDDDFNDVYYLTMKGKKLRGKSRQEDEVRLCDDPRNILTALGYVTTTYIRKMRWTFKGTDVDTVDKVEVCIDAVDNLGTFVEVEMLACPDDCIKEIMDDEEQLLRELGVTALLINESYPEMMMLERIEKV
jgi:predicted adenylyl cyclase CyaB